MTARRRCEVGTVRGAKSSPCPDGGAAVSWPATSAPSAASGRPTKASPNILLGSVGGVYHTLSRSHRGGLFATPGFGGGIRHWSADRTWFVAPEAQFAMNAVLTLNVTVGFAL